MNDGTSDGAIADMDIPIMLIDDGACRQELQNIYEMYNDVMVLFQEYKQTWGTLVEKSKQETAQLKTYIAQAAIASKRVREHTRRVLKETTK